MENKTELTKDQLEYLTQYFLCVKKAYYIQFSKTLETVDQIIDVIKSGEFTFDDVFATYLDGRLDHLDTKAQYYYDDNMQMFDCENYFPPTSKRVEEGAWIKIRTENGYEVHFAKKSNRKRRFEEEHIAVQKKLIRLMNRQMKDIQDVNKKVKDVVTDKVKSKQKALEDKLLELEVMDAIELKPYEVKIMRTKSVAEYYLPYQYELVTDIDEISNAYIQSLPGISMKALYSSQNKDAVFYLQSRGISKKVAEMMAALKQTYFIVNIVEMSNVYNDILKERVQFVEA